MNETYLRQLIGTGTPDSEIQKLEGSSNTEVYRVANKIYKIGPQQDIALAFQANRRFQDCAPISNKDIFPAIEFSPLGAEQAALIVEYCGSRNFEDLILKSDLSDESTYNTVQLVHVATLQNLRGIFEESKLDSPARTRAESSRFFQELSDALKVNLTLAGLIGSYGDTLDRVGSSREKFVSEDVPSLAHKDLSVGNVVVGDDWTSVKFIDPRLVVPHLEPTEPDTALGNIAIDIVGYQISLLRKQLELVHSGKADRLSPLLSGVSAEIKRYIQDGVFTNQMKLLCEVVWYSVFSACKCDYCLAPERKWLYDLMAEKTHEKLSQLSKVK